MHYKMYFLFKVIVKGGMFEKTKLLNKEQWKKNSMPPIFHVHYKQLEIFVVRTSDVEAFWLLTFQQAHHCCYGFLSTDLGEDCRV